MTRNESRRARRVQGVGVALLALAGLLVAPPLFAARVELWLQQPDSRPLADAVLYALPLQPPRLPPPARAEITQRQRRFEPQILPVQRGATVVFPNEDSITHHVFSFSRAKRIDLYLRRGERREVTFDRAGVVALGCNIHDWMLAYVLVVDTPWYTQADTEGHAVLPELPAGSYQLVVWHPRITDAAPSLQRAITLAAGGTETWRLRLRSALLPARDQKPGFTDY